MRHTDRVEEERRTAGEGLHGTALADAARDAHASQREDGQQALYQHGAVGDFFHIALRLDLLRSRAATHDAVETAARTAGDSDEKKRHQIAPVLRLEARIGRQVEAAVKSEHPDHSQRHDRIEESRAQKIAGLHEHPDRQDRRQIAIGEHGRHPYVFIQSRRGKLYTHPEPEVGQPHEDRDENLIGNRRTLRKQTEEQSHQNEPARRRRHRRLVDEADHRQVEEDHDHIDQGHDNEDEKQFTRRLPDQVTAGRGNGAPPVTERHQGAAKIMHSTHKDRAHDNPKPSRQPAEDRGRNDRPHNRPRAGDGGEMVPEKHRSPRRHIVHPVVDLAGRRLTIWLDPATALQEPAVKTIGQRQQHGRGNK